MRQRFARSTAALGARVAVVAAAGVLLAWAAIARAAEPEPPRPVIYRWVDENGIPHFTAHKGRIPSGLRENATEVRAAEPSTSGSQEAWIARDAGAAAAASSAATAAGESAFRESERPGDDAQLDAPAPAETGAAPTAAARAADVASSARPADAGDLDGRIAALEREIARDEAALQDLLSEPSPDGAPISERAEFREIAQRLPKRQADLRSLLDERGRLGRP